MKENNVKSKKLKKNIMNWLKKSESYPVEGIVSKMYGWSEAG